MANTPIDRVPIVLEQALYRDRLRKSGAMRRGLQAAAVHQTLGAMVGTMLSWRRARQAAKDAS